MSLKAFSAGCRANAKPKDGSEKWLQERNVVEEMHAQRREKARKAGFGVPQDCIKC